LAIAALQHGRRRLFALLLFLTLLASPLALLLLVLVLAGGAVERPPRRATVAVIVIAVAIELILRRLFPDQGKFPFSVADLVPRRIVLAVPLVAIAGFWNISALAHTVRAAAADPAHSSTYWQPAIKYLRSHLSASYRVEAVDTIEHWPAAYLPDAGIPIVRGWYRQNDF